MKGNTLKIKMFIMDQEQLLIFLKEIALFDTCPAS